MLGWEFPPFFAGGVGIVCYELTKALCEFDDLEIEYVMAYGIENQNISNKIKLTSANELGTRQENLKINKIKTLLYSYDNNEYYKQRYKRILKDKKNANSNKSLKEIYGKNLLYEVYLYSQRIADYYKDGDFDIIHAHDWTTVPAALLLKKLTGKPIIFHVHITELDKTGGMGGWEEVFKIERWGFEQADILIAVSNFVKNRLINDYKVDPNKIRVIHNGGISDLKPSLISNNSILPNSKIVLFAGRMTLQKGPRHFLIAAKKVLEYNPDVSFVMIGSGDMLSEIIEFAVELGISKNVFFHGQYSRDEANRFFERADVFVMPSVSEPFGIVSIEAIAKGTPSIISKQSGISEVLQNVFKVDFWDCDEMAHKILALLQYPTLHSHIKNAAFSEIDKFSWDKPAKKCHDLYKELNKN